MADMQSLKERLSWLTHHLIGRIQWQAPNWLTWSGRQGTRAVRYFTEDPKRAAALLVVVLALTGGLVWYLNRPIPHYVTYTVTPPALTEYNEKGISRIYPIQVVFSETTAPLEKIEKPVTAGIEVSPAIAGTWFWVSDKELQFKPKDDWPIAVAFTVRFAKRDFAASHVQFERYSFKFNTQPFSARIAASQFYQDPRDPNLKKLVATVQFSHPVEAEPFESRVSFAVPKDADYLGLKVDSRNFTLSYDKFRLAAYVHSAPLDMPRDDTPMTLRIDKGVRASRGGNETDNRLEVVVMIPGRSSLRFSNARMTLVDNARYEPEQILLVSSSSPVPEKALTGKVSAYVLPARHPKQPEEDKQPYRWDDATQIGNDILMTSQPLILTYVASDDGADTSHGFKFLAPVGRYLFVAVKDGVQGTGGYIAGKPYIATFQVQPYRQALTFLGQGALLSLSGDKKIGFLVRDVDKVEVEIGRILPNQIHHLAPAMSNFSRPNVYQDLEDKLVERLTLTRDYRGNRPGKPIYDSIDLGQYLLDKAQMRRGLFLLHVRSVQTEKKSGEEEFAAYRYGGRLPQIEDIRPVLVTELGFIVKQAKGGSRDILVHSVRTGEPLD